MIVGCFFIKSAPVGDLHKKGEATLGYDAVKYEGTKHFIYEIDITDSTK